MRIISRRRLREFWKVHPEAKTKLSAWYKVMETTNWKTFHELRGTFPSADQVGRLVVFNVGSYRVTTRVWYGAGKVYVRDVLTHPQYESGRWKDDPWF